MENQIIVFSLFITRMIIMKPHSLKSILLVLFYYLISFQEIKFWLNYLCWIPDCCYREILLLYSLYSSLNYFIYLYLSGIQHSNMLSTSQFHLPFGSRNNEIFVGLFIWFHPILTWLKMGVILFIHLST